MRQILILLSTASFLSAAAVSVVHAQERLTPPGATDTTHARGTDSASGVTQGRSSTMIPQNGQPRPGAADMQNSPTGVGHPPQ
jgi:hypothetical protein